MDKTTLSLFHDSTTGAEKRNFQSYLVRINKVQGSSSVNFRKGNIYGRRKGLKEL